MEKRIALTTEEGSRQIIYGALAGAGSKEEEERLKGAYIASSQIREVSDFVLSEVGVKAQEKLWVSVAFLFITVVSFFDSHIQNDIMGILSAESAEVATTMGVSQSTENFRSLENARL